MVAFLVRNGVEPSYAQVFVRQQLTRAQSYQGQPILPYGDRQYSPRHYDELGKLLLVRSGRGRPRPEEAKAKDNGLAEMRSRVARDF